MSKFIVIEGLDGAGKSTQIKLLGEYLERNKINYKVLHFPRVEETMIGEMISAYLRGEYGDIDEVDPHLVAQLYAADRNDAKVIIQKWLNEGNYVIVDRYVYSNIVFQCAKISNDSIKNNLRDWILNLEYSYYKIPKPDINIYLSLPINYIKKKLDEEREGTDREYLKGKTDIHEKNIVLQKNVDLEYKKLIKLDEFFINIDCYKNNNISLPKKINKEIIKLLKKINRL